MAHRNLFAWGGWKCRAGADIHWYQTDRTVIE